MAVLLITAIVCFADENDMTQKTLTINGEQRVFYVHLPPDYQNEKEKNFPVVIIFHGTVADANKIKNYTKFNDFADKNNIVAVYPEYTGTFDWELKPAEKSKDIKFISEMIDFLKKNYKIDEKRVYAAGYSSGSEMNYLLACTIPDKIAAFAPVAGNLRKSYVEGCKNFKPTSIMLVHGTDDPYEKWDGNPLKNMLTVDETLDFFKKRNKCTASQKEISFPHVDSENNTTNVKLIMNDSCKDNTEVSILKVEGGGHTWPGSPTSVRIETFLGKTNYDISGNEVIWEFFKRHKLS